MEETSFLCLSPALQKETQQFLDHQANCSPAGQLSRPWSKTKLGERKKNKEEKAGRQSKGGEHLAGARGSE